jgi:hypothetical protein
MHCVCWRGVDIAWGEAVWEEFTQNRFDLKWVKTVVWMGFFTQKRFDPKWVKFID